MKKIFIFVCCFNAVCTNNVDATTLLNSCTDIDCDSANFLVSAPIGCGNYYTKHCKKTSTGMIMGYADCYSCINSSYELTSTTTTCGNSIITHNTCESACAECTDCTSDTSWSTAVTPTGAELPSHQQKTTRTCDCGTCVETTQYRCAAGYYGNPTSILSICATCPQPGTSAAGSTAKTSCYIPSGTSMTDNAGTYQFTTKCYYTN